MMKIVRLALFNIKKSKKEAVAIAFLAFVSALFLGMIVTNVGRIDTAFHDSFVKSGSYNTCVLIPEDKYRENCRNILMEDYGIADPVRINALLTMGYSLKDKNGDTYSINLFFVTPTSEKRIEAFEMKESLTDDEASNISHPIWLPTYFKYNRGYSLSEEFDLVMNGRDYPFTIVGFYETGLMANENSIVKCVISEEDYRLLEPISKGYVSLHFDYDDFPFGEYGEKCDESTSENLSSDMVEVSEESEKKAEAQFLDIFLTFLGFFSVIVLVSAMFMVSHKIGKDIEDQMEQIGVLEALGYQSREISSSYICEYLLSAGVGALIGGMVTLLLTPVFNWMISVMMGRTCSGGLQILPVLGVTVLVVVLIVMFALTKARQVKKYPPVVAFRKGIKTHHFGKNHLPLEHTKGNINVRIAMKDFLGELKSSVGVCICIAIASLAILFVMSLTYFLRTGYHALVRCLGTEVSEVIVTLENGIDVDEIKEEISQMSEVRKTLLSFGDSTQYVKVMGSDMNGAIVAFEDYSQTENIFLSEGRYPIYDNEVMISVGRREQDNVHIGDSIVLQGDAAAKKYVITGVASGMLNSGSAIYFNGDGLKRLNPYATFDSINIYLKDGVDKEEFQKKLALMYGASTEDAQANANTLEEMALEERIQAIADEKIAVLKSQYGVTGLEYAIVIGDKVITGNSSKFKIKKVGSMLDLARGQTEQAANITRVFSVLSALVIAGIVAVILGIISVSNVRRKKKEIGIMKSLGYSSKDLMTQMAIRIMPATVVGVGIASVLVFYVYNLFWVSAFCVETKPAVGVVMIVDIVLILFCYFVTYISAGRVKKISVTELMTE